MRLDLMTIAWGVYGFIVIRMALRMADGGAEPLHFLLMGLAGVTLAVLIALVGMPYRRWRNRARNWRCAGNSGQS